MREENGKLRAENLSLREAMAHPACGGCGGPVQAMLGESPSLEEQDLRVQNATLKSELSRFCALASAFLGRSISFAATQPMPGPGSPLEHIGSAPATTVANSTITEFTGSPSSTMGMAKATIDKSVFLELATSAVDELVKMAQMDEPLWIPNVPLPGSPAKETLNYEEYLKTFSPTIGVKPPGFVSEASRDSGIVTSDGSVELMESLLDEVVLFSPCPPSCNLVAIACMSDFTLPVLKSCYRDGGPICSRALSPNRRQSRRSLLELQEVEMVHCCL